MASGTPLHPLLPSAISAIGAGDVAALSGLLDRAPELVRARSAPPVKATLLHYSSFNGTEELAHAAPPSAPDVARLLLRRGAEPDALAFDTSGNTALCWALSSWFNIQNDVMNDLADAYLDGGAAIEGVDGDGAPLGHAIGFGYTRAVEHLAARGAFVDHLTAAAALGDLPRLTGWFQGDGRFAPTAMNFARGPKPETGRFSWPPPSDPDPSALALVTAATHGRAEVVGWLLDQGIDPSASVSMGQTALHFAAYIGHPRVVEMLLAAGARPDAIEAQFDRTPSDWAKETDEPELAALIDGHRSGK